jgi:hypothetical protein
MARHAGLENIDEKSRPLPIMSSSRAPDSVALTLASDISQEIVLRCAGNLRFDQEKNARAKRSSG